VVAAVLMLRRLWVVWGLPPRTPLLLLPKPSTL